ncbi:MAG: hypothetical protein HC880_00440 [Bacteroidia bacterium]|nr:hypothetical protein [Bacteroidia bacterium]
MVDVTGLVEYTIERNYGADADGNRGCSKVIVQNVSNIKARDDQMNEVELNKLEEESAIDELVRNFLES